MDPELNQLIADLRKMIAETSEIRAECQKCFELCREETRQHQGHLAKCKTFLAEATERLRRSQDIEDKALENLAGAQRTERELKECLHNVTGN